MPNVLHDKVLDFLLQYRRKHPDFVWWLRERDTNNRLTEGYWFQGLPTYAFVGLYNASGGANRTRSVGLVFWHHGGTDKVGVHFEVVYKGEANNKLVTFYQLLMKTVGNFEGGNEKYYKYFAESDGFKAAEDFLDKVKPIIDKLVESQGLNDIFISKSDFESKLQNILNRRKALAKSRKMNFPLNSIFYGPPGTGKTYNTLKRSVEIVKDEDYNGRYDEAKQLFKTLLEDQIEFVTFHQNYSYEDFMAGLRPDVDVTSSGLKFKEHKGIFYRICEKARKNFEESRSGRTYVEATFEEALNEFLKPLTERDEPVQLSTVARNVSFKIYQIFEKNLGLEKQSGSREHTLSMTTLKGLYEGKREYNLQGLGVYYYPTVAKLKEIAKNLRKEVGEIKLKNYVLIIDEINRANISRVFGELITLIEPDKRLGNLHELKLRLPGLPDDELFSVPPNLYIVATMNTADKSIALLDIALRRRFVFEAMYPNLELVESPYKKFLEALNETILDKKGADFMIGHSYLMPDEIASIGFENIMNRKIIPLLNEYFYNNRSISVFDLLKDITEKAGSYEVVVNSYKEVICQSKS